MTLVPITAEIVVEPVPLPEFVIVPVLLIEVIPKVTFVEVLLLMVRFPVPAI